MGSYLDTAGRKKGRRRKYNQEDCVGDTRLSSGTNTGRVTFHHVQLYQRVIYINFDLLRLALLVFFSVYIQQMRELRTYTRSV
jgi:hypothetical protein